MRCWPSARPARFPIGALIARSSIGSRPMCSTRCAETIPSLEIPFHARWRHFAAGGVDRWARLAASTPWRDGASRARGAFDLAIVSVLLDAGAGPDWGYRAEDGSLFSRSEGLALASFDMFARGPFRRIHKTSFGRTPRGSFPSKPRRSPRASRSRPKIRSSGSKGAPLFCARSGARSRQRRRSSPRATPQGRAASSTISSARARRLPASRRPPSSRPCSPISGRSGRRAFACRHRARGLLAPSRASARGRHERPRALPQALAMALLFPDRAASGGGNHGHRDRWAHRLARISKWWAFHRFGGVLSLKRKEEAEAPHEVSLRARRRMARAHRRAPRRDRDASSVARSGSTRRRCPWRRCSKAAPGRPAGASPARSAPTARRP